MLNADMSLQKLYARLPLLNTPYGHSYLQWPEVEVIVTADRFLPQPFKVTNCHGRQLRGFARGG